MYQKVSFGSTKNTIKEIQTWFYDKKNYEIFRRFDKKIYNNLTTAFTQKKTRRWKKLFRIQIVWRLSWTIKVKQSQFYQFLTFPFHAKSGKFYQKIFKKKIRKNFIFD